MHKEARAAVPEVVISKRRSVIGKCKLFLVVTPFLLGGCVDTIFGCRDDLLTDVTTSPDGRYKAVTRECGCGASTSTYILTAVVAQGQQESCKALREHWVASMRASTHGEDPSRVETHWIDRSNLLVRLEHRQLYDLDNYRRDNQGQLYDVPGPNITVHSDL